MLRTQTKLRERDNEKNKTKKAKANAKKLEKLRNRIKSMESQYRQAGYKFQSVLEYHPYDDDDDVRNDRQASHAELMNDMSGRLGKLQIMINKFKVQDEFNELPKQTTRIDIRGSHLSNEFF